MPGSLRHPSRASRLSPIHNNRRLHCERARAPWTNPQISYDYKESRPFISLHFENIIFYSLLFNDDWPSELSKRKNNKTQRGEVKQPKKEVAAPFQRVWPAVFPTPLCNAHPREKDSGKKE